MALLKLLYNVYKTWFKMNHVKDKRNVIFSRGEDNGVSVSDSNLNYVH